MRCDAISEQEFVELGRKRGPVAFFITCLKDCTASVGFAAGGRVSAEFEVSHITET